jgi:hypothetical protein
MLDEPRGGSSRPLEAAKAGNGDTGLHGDLVKGAPHGVAGSVPAAIPSQQGCVRRRLLLASLEEQRTDKAPGILGDGVRLAGEADGSPIVGYVTHAEADQLLRVRAGEQGERGRRGVQGRAAATQPCRHGLVQHGTSMLGVECGQHGRIQLEQQPIPEERGLGAAESDEGLGRRSGGGRQRVEPVGDLVGEVVPGERQRVRTLPPVGVVRLRPSPALPVRLGVQPLQIAEVGMPLGEPLKDLPQRIAVGSGRPARSCRGGVPPISTLLANSRVV